MTRCASQAVGHGRSKLLSMLVSLGNFGMPTLGRGMLVMLAFTRLAAAVGQELLQRLRKKGNRENRHSISHDDVRRATSKLQVLGNGFKVKHYWLAGSSLLLGIACCLLRIYWSMIDPRRNKDDQ